MIANQAGTTVWRWDNQEPFGSDLPNDDPDGDSVPFVFNLRFPGQYFDRETNVAYNYFRDYDPAIGRYVESDPVELRGRQEHVCICKWRSAKLYRSTGINLL